MKTPTLVSIQVGRPTTYGRAEAMDRLWTTSFFKLPIAGPVFVSRTNVAGDEQTDLKFHGGVDKAVLAYSADHYELWRRELNRDDLCFGGFGENLTIAELSESDVCIGDVWSLGEVLFEVSQPRQPCWKLARRWRIKELTALVVQNSRSGWYLRVLREGMIDTGQSLALVARPHPEWTVLRASEVMHHQKEDIALAQQLAELPELAASWQESLLARVNR